MITRSLLSDIATLVSLYLSNQNLYPPVQGSCLVSIWADFTAVNHESCDENSVQSLKKQKLYLYLCSFIRSLHLTVCEFAASCLYVYLLKSSIAAKALWSQQYQLPKRTGLSGSLGEYVSVALLLLLCFTSSPWVFRNVVCPYCVLALSVTCSATADTA